MTSAGRWHDIATGPCGHNRYGSHPAQTRNRGVYGSALIVGGELESNAEVNGYVIALFGDIKLGSAATCHRDVLAVGGRIQRDRKARIYGAFQSTESWKRSDIFRRRQRNYGYQPMTWSKGMSYNRVDGSTLNAGVAFQSELLATILCEVGYGASSNIWKYRLGLMSSQLSQLSHGAMSIARPRPPTIGSAPAENTVYALLRREDSRLLSGRGAGYLSNSRSMAVTVRADYFVKSRLSGIAIVGMSAASGFRSNFSSKQRE
jgi:hypothetical protein